MALHSRSRGRPSNARPLDGIAEDTIDGRPIEPLRGVLAGNIGGTLWDRFIGMSIASPSLSHERIGVAANSLLKWTTEHAQLSLGS